MCWLSIISCVISAGLLADCLVVLLIHLSLAIFKCAYS